MTMKIKTIVFILVITGIILAVLVGIYFYKQNKYSAQNPLLENTSNVPAKETAGSPAPDTTPPAIDQGETGSGAGENKQIKTEPAQNKLVTDDFDIVLPAGWKQTAPTMGASAMAVNVDENMNDPAAQKINFKSYFAVSYDTSQGKGMIEYLQIVKDGLQQAIPSAVFTKEQNMTINGRSASALETELTQQGVNFKILMVVVKGSGEDVWIISFNTTKSGWDGYKDTFYSIANSFNLKK